MLDPPVLDLLADHRAGPDLTTKPETQQVAVPSTDPSAKGVEEAKPVEQVRAVEEIKAA